MSVGVLFFAALGLSACGTTDDPGPDGDSQGGSSSGSSSKSGGSGTKGGSSSGQGSGGKAEGSAGKAEGSAGKAEGSAGKAEGGGGGGSGGGSPVDSSFPDAQAYVDAHNKVRAAVEKPAGYAGDWQSLPNVRWSDEVAVTAQEWANQLRDTNDCGLDHAQGTGYGENLAGGGGLGAKQAVELWASEIDNYTYAEKYQFRSDTGHYTQIVWRTSTSIGCGRAECGRSAVVVCRYDPPGNFIGGRIF